MVTKKVKDTNKIKGGKADNLTAEDLAMKHYQFVGTIENEIELGTTVEMEHTKDKEKAREIAMDHIDEFPFYYSDKDNGLIAMEKKQEKTNESLTKKITNLLREAVELETVDESPTDITYSITNEQGIVVGKVMISPIDFNGSKTIIIRQIILDPDHKSIKTILDTVNHLMVVLPEVDKMLVSPAPNVVNMAFNGGDWNKIHFNRLNDDWLIRMRGH